MNAPTLLKRALKADPQELTTRLAQLWFTARNRRKAKSGASVFSAGGHLHSLGVSELTIAEWFRARSSRWFLSPERLERIRELYEERELERALVLRRAETVVNGKMPLFSHEPVDFVGDDRWRRDHILGVSAPQKFYGDIRYLDSSEVGDSKHVWEPNRFCWVYWLGAAYVITADDKYADAFAELFMDWCEHNAYPIGINYSSSLEIGLRNYALVWALACFRRLFVADSVMLSRALEVMWVGCKHIERSLSYYFAPNTHLTGEAFALYACGAAFPEFSESDRWRSQGATILAKESRKQFHLDGTHRELSTSYHLYSTDFYVQASLIASETGFTLPEEIRKRARDCADRLTEIALEDLHLPQLNDCDGGRLTSFAFHPLDAGPSLYSAAEMFDDFIVPASTRLASGYALWMTGLQSARAESPGVGDVSSRTLVGTRYDATQERAESEHDSGLVVYRNSARDYLLARAGEFGYLDSGHSHDGQLGFSLYFAGEPLVVDCGTGAYTQSAELRNRYRSAHGKNTPLINARGPSEPDGWFTWKRGASAHVTGARDFDGGFYFKGRHNGFSEACGFEVEVAREIILLDDGLCLIVDEWTAKQEVSYSLNYTLHPRLTATREGRMIFEEDGSECHYLVSPQFACGKGEPSEVESDDELNTPRFRPRVVQGPYSPDYGVIGETAVLSCELGKRSTGSVVTIFSRIGPMRFTRDATKFIVGEEGTERELQVGASGKISLSGLVKGDKQYASVDFAR